MPVLDPKSLVGFWEQEAAYSAQQQLEFAGLKGLENLAGWYEGRASIYTQCADDLRKWLAAHKGGPIPVKGTGCGSSQHDDAECPLGTDCPCYIVGCEEQRAPP